MVIKKMTQDNIDETKDLNYYENFLQDHLKKKYDRLYPKITTPSSTPASTPSSTPPSTPISTPISTPTPIKTKKISVVPKDSPMMVEVKPVFEKKEEVVEELKKEEGKKEVIEEVIEEVKKEEGKKEEGKKEEGKKGDIVDNFIESYPQINQLMNKILKTYKEDNKLNDHGIFMLNELLLKYGKKK